MVMDIQGISGFQLTARTVTPADGRPLSRPRTHLFNRCRSPAETKTIDFRYGLEAYIPPRVFKWPKSSPGRQKSRSKAPDLQSVPKERCSEPKETSLDIKESEKELEAMTRADIKEIVPQERISDTKDELHVMVQHQKEISVLSSGESIVPDRGVVCTCSGFNVVGMESKRYGDYASSEESRAWFEKTLQEYEDLKKSVEAQISSTPSDQRSEIGPDANPRSVKVSSEETTLQEASSDGRRKDADEAYSDTGCTSKFSPLGSPALSIYSCGCPAKSSPSRSPTKPDMGAVKDAVWKEMVETVTELRETNRALQRTVKELQERPYNNKRQPCDLGTPAEFKTKTDSLHCSSTTLYEPELRKRVLDTLRKSVHKMESLMVALRDEQEKSSILSLQLQRFLSASRDRTPHPTPPTSVTWSRSTSPVEPCSTTDCSHQCQTFPALSPAFAPWTRALSPAQSVTQVCHSDNEYLYHRPTSRPSGNYSRSLSPTPF